MTKTIEFYWDLGSTNSYFALHLIKPGTAGTGRRWGSDLVALSMRGVAESCQ